MSERDSYLCPKCHVVSYHPDDIKNLYCGRCHLFAEDMRDETVTSFAHITSLHLTRRDCFSLAMLALADCNLSDARLVHAWVKSSWSGEWIQHAWCEMPALATFEDESTKHISVMVDHTQVDERARILPVDFAYERVGEMRHVIRYTAAEAYARALAVGHDGPWPEDNP